MQAQRRANADGALGFGSLQASLGLMSGVVAGHDRRIGPGVVLCVHQTI